MKYYVTPCGNKVMLLQPEDGEAPALQAVLYSDYAKLEAELATAKAQEEKVKQDSLVDEINELKSKCRALQNAYDTAVSDTAHTDLVIEGLRAERDRLEQENKRLKAPVSDEEWIKRAELDELIAARAEQEKGAK